MIVSVARADGKLIWSREVDGKMPSTFTSSDTLHPAVADSVIEALSQATEQAAGQLGRFEIRNAVSVSGLAAAQVDRNVPVSRMRDLNAGRETFIEPAIMAEVSAGPVQLKVGIVHHQYVALMAALNDNNIAGV